MRISNCECIVCGKRFYRRPFELKKVKFVCCRVCRGTAYKRYPNECALKNLKLGRIKGTNHLEGIPKKQSHKNKITKIMKEWSMKNKDKIIQRGLKIRGEKHYNWKGGVSELNKSIRRLSEYRKWAHKIKELNNFKCSLCSGSERLETHHIIPLVFLLEKHNIKTREDARKCKYLWDLNNGVCVCLQCHYKIHNRKYTGGRKK